jgi:hypothetical protein
MILVYLSLIPRKARVFVSAIELLAAEGGLCKEWLFSVPTPQRLSLSTFRVEFFSN